MKLPEPVAPRLGLGEAAYFISYLHFKLRSSFPPDQFPSLCSHIYGFLYPFRRFLFFSRNLGVTVASTGIDGLKRHNGRSGCNRENP